MPTAQKSTASTDDGKREFIVRATKFDVLANHEEVWAAKREGRAAAGVPHYFSEGDRIALTHAYMERFPIVNAIKSGSLEPVEVAEKRAQVAAKQAEADQASAADREKIEAELRETQREIEDNLRRHEAATLLEEFTP